MTKNKLSLKEFHDKAPGDAPIEFSLPSKPSGANNRSTVHHDGGSNGKHVPGPKQLNGEHHTGLHAVGTSHGYGAPPPPPPHAAYENGYMHGPPSSYDGPGFRLDQNQNQTGYIRGGEAYGAAPYGRANGPPGLGGAVAGGNGMPPHMPAHHYAPPPPPPPPPRSMPAGQAQGMPPPPPLSSVAAAGVPRHMDLSFMPPPPSPGHNSYTRPSQQPAPPPYAPPAGPALLPSVGGPAHGHTALHAPQHLPPAVHPQQQHHMLAQLQTCAMQFGTLPGAFSPPYPGSPAHSKQGPAAAAPGGVGQHPSAATDAADGYRREAAQPSMHAAQAHAAEAQARAQHAMHHASHAPMHHTAGEYRRDAQQQQQQQQQQQPAPGEYHREARGASHSQPGEYRRDRSSMGVQQRGSGAEGYSRAPNGQMHTGQVAGGPQHGVHAQGGAMVAPPPPPPPPHAQQAQRSTAPAAHTTAEAKTAVPGSPHKADGASESPVPAAPAAVLAQPEPEPEPPASVPVKNDWADKLAAQALARMQGTAKSSLLGGGGSSYTPPTSSFQSALAAAAAGRAVTEAAVALPAQAPATRPSASLSAPVSAPVIERNEATGEVPDGRPRLSLKPRAASTEAAANPERPASTDTSTAGAVSDSREDSPGLASAAVGRPRLNLQPRSKPLAVPTAAAGASSGAVSAGGAGSQSGSAGPCSAASSAPRSSIFGAAKPREQVLKERGLNPSVLDSALGRPHHSYGHNSRSVSSVVSAASGDEDHWVSVGRGGRAKGGGPLDSDAGNALLDDVNPFFSGGSGLRAGSSRPGYGYGNSGGGGYSSSNAYGSVFGSRGFGGASHAEDDGPVFRRALPTRNDAIL